MKSITALCAGLVAAAAAAGGPAAADDRCPPAGAAAGLCAPLHFVDDDSTQDLLRRRAYELGYRDALSRGKQVAPPPDIALDGKEGYSQSYEVHRQYLDRNGNRYEGDRYYDREDYYKRRLRRDDAGEVVDFATQILRGIAN